MNTKIWVYEQARGIIVNLINSYIPSPDKKEVFSLLSKNEISKVCDILQNLVDKVIIFETGYGPSGLPHIGTFGEVARTQMVRTAFDVITESRFISKIICFSDDLDAMRRVPENVPNKEMLVEYLNKPLSNVPDPFGQYESFSAHNNARLQAFLDSFGFDYEFRSATDYYKSGKFNETLLTALERFDQIQNIMLPTLGDERRETYSCFLPISPKTGNVLQTATIERNLSQGTIVFRDETGELIEVPVTDGYVKMQWKADWAMRWANQRVDYEMYGKDLIESAKVSQQICRVLGVNPPAGFNYELFLDKDGKKISKSIGNGISMDEWLMYAPKETLSYYMYLSPSTAKKLHFDVIPKSVDDYFKAIDLYHTQTNEEQIENPVYFIHNGDVPNVSLPIPFSMLLNLVSVANSDDVDVVKGFLTSYGIEINQTLEDIISYAIQYYINFELPKKNYKIPNNQELIALTNLRAVLSDINSSDAEIIQTAIYDVGKNNGYENDLKAWFQLIYEVLLGKEQGPRFGTFVSIYGIDRTINLIDERLNNGT